MTEFLRDGYQTLVTFPSNPSIKFKEKSVQPFGITGGGGIDQTTMRNSAVRTSAPKSLYAVSDGALTVQYDVAVYPEIQAMINVNQLIVITFPDGDTLLVWSWLDEFTPGDHVEGEMPEADCVMIASNLDASWVETPPVRAAATTTT